jgi:cell division protein FtsL
VDLSDGSDSWEKRKEPKDEKAARIQRNKEAFTKVYSIAIPALIAILSLVFVVLYMKAAAIQNGTDAVPIQEL